MLWSQSLPPRLRHKDTRAEDFPSNSLSFRQTSTSVRSCRACARAECASTPSGASSVNVPEDTLSTQTPECAKVTRKSTVTSSLGRDIDFSRPGIGWRTTRGRDGKKCPVYLKTLNSNRARCLHQSHYLMCCSMWPDGWIPVRPRRCDAAALVLSERLFARRHSGWKWMNGRESEVSRCKKEASLNDWPWPWPNSNPGLTRTLPWPQPRPQGWRGSGTSSHLTGWRAFIQRACGPTQRYQVSP